MKWKELLLVLGSILFTLAVFIFVFEAGARLFPDKFSGADWYLGGNHPRGLVTKDKDLIYGLTPNLHTRDVNIHGDFDVPVEINSLGLRDYERDMSACTDKIIGLGDSFTYGEGVPLEKTYLARFEEKLNAVTSEQYCIIKAGVPGYGLHQMNSMYRKLAEKYRHRMGIVSVVEDDFTRMEQGFVEFNGWLVHEGWKNILQSCPDGRIHVRKEHLNDLHHFLICNSRTYSWLSQRVLPINGGKRLGELILQDLKPSDVSHEPDDRIADYFLEMKSVSDQHGADMLVIAFCFDDTNLATFLRKNGIGFLPIPCNRSWFFENDRHFNELGHESVADLITGPVLWKIKLENDPDTRE